MRGWAAPLLLVVAVGSAAVAESYPRELRFVRPGAPDKVLTVAALEASCGAETISIDDPYYGTRKRFRACPLAKVVELGFGVAASSLSGESVVFRARDGYAKPASGVRLAEPGGWLAFADADHMQGDDPGWQPIDRKQVDPGPFYLVWSGAAQHDATAYPWPYQLAAIELTPIEVLFPHIVPSGVAADSPAQAGYQLFKAQCVACHAINGEGGTIGPELNVPRSIVEYRPVEQIKAYIRDPQSFRYTSMPPHLSLSDGQLDTLIAYFSAMKDRKHDPRRAR
ncbi:MAG: cytochrome c [Deltaproteobacteria bacterium]|nr:cytochrome c [Deltaproteobacteria bacterium]